MTAAPAPGPALGVYPAWVWMPDALVRVRGVYTARLLVLPRLLVVTANRIGRATRTAPDLVEYTWPAVVVERHRPMTDVGVLLEIDGKLGRVQASGGSRGRLAATLRAAGFEVVEVTHTGWEAPRAATPAEVGDAADRLPSCVVARG